MGEREDRLCKGHRAFVSWSSLVFTLLNPAQGDAKISGLV